MGGTLGRKLVHISGLGRIGTRRIGRSVDFYLHTFLDIMSRLELLGHT